MSIDVERQGAVAIATLNRPDKLNALNDDMKSRLTALFDELARDETVRAVLLTARGRGFCAGGDVGTMKDFTAATARARIKAAQRTILGVYDIDKPVVAAVRGPVAGIGWSLALACDAIVASETAKFSQAFRRIGLVPDGGSIFFLNQLIGPVRAKELILTARSMPAEEAARLGLVTRVVADDRLEAEALDLVRDLAEGPSLAFAMGKKMFKSLNEPSLEAFLELEAHTQALALLSEDHKEGGQAFREKRPPVFRGC